MVEVCGLLVIFALIGLAVLFKRRNQSAARPLSGSAYERAADSYTPARYYNQQSKNPQIVNPQKTDEEKE